MPEKRQINDIERNELRQAINQLENNFHGNLNWKAIIILIIATIFFGVHIYYYEDSNWSLPSKFLVCACPIMIWIIIENKYKGRKKANKEIVRLKEMNETGIISVMPIKVHRVIEFEQKDDEGTLFLLETIKNDRIYLDDEQWLIPHPEKFPCNEFDIYLDKVFLHAIGSKIYCRGKKIEPIKVEGNLKWKYFENGFPDDLSKEEKTFEQILSEIKSIELNNLL